MDGMTRDTLRKTLHLLEQQTDALTKILYLLEKQAKETPPCYEEIRKRFILICYWYGSNPDFNPDQVYYEEFGDRLQGALAERFPEVWYMYRLGHIDDLLEQCS